VTPLEKSGVAVTMHNLALFGSLPLEDVNLITH